LTANALSKLLAVLRDVCSERGRHYTHTQSVEIGFLRTTKGIRLRDNRRNVTQKDVTENKSSIKKQTEKEKE
jgi:hypothetical protein